MAWCAFWRDRYLYIFCQNFNSVRYFIISIGRSLKDYTQGHIGFLWHTILEHLDSLNRCCTQHETWISKQSHESWISWKLAAGKRQLVCKTRAIHIDGPFAKQAIHAMCMKVGVATSQKLYTRNLISHLVIGIWMFMHGLARQLGSAQAYKRSINGCINIQPSNKRRTCNLQLFNSRLGWSYSIPLSVVVSSLRRQTMRNWLELSLDHYSCRRTDLSVSSACCSMRGSIHSCWVSSKASVSAWNACQSEEGALEWVLRWNTARCRQTLRTLISQQT